MKPVFAKAQDPAEARHLCRGRGRARAARRAGGARGEAGAADPGRPPGGRRGAHQALRPVDPAGRDFDLINPEDDPRYRYYVQTYIEVAGRRGVTPDAARTMVRTNATVIAALAVMRGEADAMICGVEGRYMSHLRHVREIIGLRPASATLRRWRW